ncbi:portal vertex protein [Tenacibaculum phage PTm1]|uniref:Portal vertex protein n=2 Tax=Shirahamavirus PTm1 TaxID=2846435 RepID=A0A5S9HXG7_9CAUD|nr:portal vertex protein [Tenacibaculum phage PTm1]BBI90690.1 portal vertex protein [Tenacibaculum phage PTm1]BBI90997.1 portal vertex protein [Tenacibaculum phage PTm5]
MAKKQNNDLKLIQIPGVTNYDKLRSNSEKKDNFMKFNPFVAQKYNELVKKNHEGESIQQEYLDEQIYQQFLLQSGVFNNSRFGNRGKRTSFFNLDPKSKRSELIRLSSHDQLDEILTKLTDELVVTDQHNTQALSVEIDKNKLEASKISPSIIKKIEDSASRALDDIYYLYGFGALGTKTSLWNKVYLFLIEGSQAYEIVYDDINNPSKIIGVLEIDSLSLEEFTHNGIKYYRHYRELAQKDKYVILHDNQIVRIDWSDGSPNNRFSYLEQLIKAFNNARIINESSIRWTVMNSMFRMIFRVPTRGKSRIASAQTLATEMNRFRDDVEYDSDTGELVVNGKTSPQFSKEYWMAEGDSGSPQIDTIENSGTAFTNPEMNEHFDRKLYRNAKLPFSRFDANSSEAWNLDTRSMLREEIAFGSFCNRIRAILQMLVLKPLYLQLALEIPELRDDQNILSCIKIRFNSYNVFEELMKMDILREKAEGIQALREAFTIETPDGAEKPFFALEFLIREHLPDIDEEKLKINNKLLEKEQKDLLEWQSTINKIQEEHQRALAEIAGDNELDEDGLTLGDDDGIK